MTLVALGAQLAACAPSPHRERTGADGDGEDDDDGEGERGEGEGEEGEGEGEGEFVLCDIGSVELVQSVIDASVDDEGTAPDLSCLGAPPVIAEGAPVAFEGCVNIFGIGGEGQRGSVLEVFRADADLAGAAEVTAPIAHGNDSAALDCDGADADEPSCLATGCPQGLFVRVAGVPSNVPLTLKTHSLDDATVIPTFTFGAVFFEADAVDDGVVAHDAFIIYRETYDSIPTLGGKVIDGQQVIGDGEGRAMILGEVRDCQGRPIRGASVASSEHDSSTKLTYFSGAGRPDPGSLHTATDGLFSLLNVDTDAGSDTPDIVAAIFDAEMGGCRSLGARAVRTFPDSVSIVSFVGELPTAP